MVNKYRLRRFRTDGSEQVTLHRWGRDCHKLGRQEPKIFVWYTIERLRDDKVVYEGKYCPSVLRNSNGCGFWDDVTHGFLEMRPDERVHFLANRTDVR
jgi:hypothetical protein